MSKLRKALGEELKACRKAQGLSLRALSAKAKVSLGFLSEIERGQKEVSSELLNAILEALNTPLSEVVLKAGASIAAQERNAVVVKMPVKDQHRAA
ncbi:MAG: helix-turn-helix domain-containing protein [Candidatus Nanopelagicales bacterium]